MKRKFVASVGALCAASMLAASVHAAKPVKTPKPDKTPGLTTECISFTGDLQSGGETRIVGCCPNAGPWPAYTMTFPDMCYQFPDDSVEYCLPDFSVDGYLFINSLGTGPTAQYKVQFWTWDWEMRSPGEGDFFVEFRGGTVVRDRKAKTLTVTFANEAATVWLYFDENEGCEPSTNPGCEPCVDMDPACDPSVDPNCFHPCNIEVSASDVDFELFRTSNLDYCE